MFAAPDWLEGFALDLAIIVGIVTGLSALVAKTRLGKVTAWVWTRLVTQPVGAWLEALMERVFDRLIQPFSDRSNNQHVEMADRFDANEKRLASVQATVSYLAERSASHDDQLASINGGLEQLSATIAANNDKLTIPTTRSPK